MHRRGHVPPPSPRPHSRPSHRLPQPTMIQCEANGIIGVTSSKCQILILEPVNGSTVTRISATTHVAHVRESEMYLVRGSRASRCPLRDGTSPTTYRRERTSRCLVETRPYRLNAHLWRNAKLPPRIAPQTYGAHVRFGPDSEERR